VFQGLDIASLEAALGGLVMSGRAPGHVEPRGSPDIAMDGKHLRCSITAQASGVHLLAAFSEAVGGVVGQLRVEPGSNGITAALAVLKMLPLAGSVVTGHAIFTQKEICRVIVDGGGSYVFIVKDNQPALRADIALAFGDVSPLGALIRALVSPA